MSAADTIEIRRLRVLAHIGVPEAERATPQALFITLRLQKGHFSADNHFGFEGAAWYWHFVDVVWLGLYVLVYWL